ncbi:MAG TPA: hypothetical protein VGI81_16400 [Tepidisphaeraceae bacterium]
MSVAHDLQFAIDRTRGSGKIVLDHYGKVSVRPDGTRMEATT